MKYKKIMALATGVTLLGATLTGCVTQKDLDAKEVELSSLSEQLKMKEEAFEAFKENKDVQVNELITSQEVSQAEIDNMKVMIEDLNEQLKESTKEVVITASGVENVEFEELDANFNDDFSVTVDDGDLNKLIDGKIVFDDENIDVKEQIIVTSDVKVKTSTFDEDFCSEPRMIVEDENSVVYKFVFDEEVDVTDISDDEPLKINFLGKELEIVEFDGDDMIVKTGQSFWLVEGQSNEGVSLVDVSSTESSAGIIVDGELEWIDLGDSHEFNNGVTVRVDDVKAVNSQLQDSDTVKVTVHSGDVVETIESGDEYSEDSDWKWVIDKTGDVLNFIGVEYDVKSDDLNDDVKPLVNGESIVLPEEYIKLTFVVPEVSHAKFSFEFDEFGNDDIPVLKITSDCEDCLVFGDEELDEIYFNGSSVFYEEDGDDMNSSETPKIVFDETELIIGINSENITIGSDIIFKHTTLDFLGSVEEDNEADEVIVDGFNVGNNDCSVLSEYGIVVDKSEDSDDFEIIVPEDEAEVHLRIQ